ncbi:hypothetical protein D9611_009057 [Ephemerocybe angulata]|uniref:Ribonuclease H1 N-terminal domain-containing protein n=1 Tax=Ephemerocybe angulata TaxID=980116 RepID=A0A8H5CF07_9AGAR|nr:hypothetical protein D9611_009057 [Tulosesus angulatus]
MVNQANTSSEGVATINRVAISPALLRLLGSLIRAIDDPLCNLTLGQLGHLILDSFVRPGDDEHELSTCARCRGTGIVTAPISVSDFEDEEFDQVSPPPSTDDAAPSSAAPAPSAPVAAVVAGTTHAAPGATPAAAVVVGPSPAAAGPIPAAAATVVAGPSPIAATLVGTAPAAPPAAPVGIAPAAPPAAPIEVPAPIAPTPGFHSLGPNVPPPAPESAVYAGNGCERYYTVTRGIRVGVFGDWMSTSPFVTGVPAASFTRHRSLIAAYEAYVTAHGRGFVTHA